MRQALDGLNPDHEVLVETNGVLCAVTGHDVRKVLRVTWCDDSVGWWPSPLVLEPWESPDVVQQTFETRAVVIVLDEQSCP